ncbi:MAG TPA: MBL fold metallo-hydrolase [Pyrinomonadaceae bacterium]
MTRQRRWACLWAMVALFISTTSLVSQQDFSKVEIKSTKVAGNVYMLEGSGGNIGVSVGPDGILIVDDQFAPLADKIKAALKSLGEGKLKFILNTHWHGDHTGGNPVFGMEAPIIAQTNVRKRLATGATVLGQDIKPAPKEALPVITFDQSLSVHFNGEEIRVIHFPHGHTDGDSVIFFTNSNVVHMGDDFFAGRFPFVDLASGGDVEGVTKNVGDIIAKLPAGVRIIPGHGPLSTIDDLKLYHRMLLETTDIVRKKMAAGKTLDQIKAEGLPDEWKTWGTGFIKTDFWLEIVFNSLKAKAKQT